MKVGFFPDLVQCLSSNKMKTFKWQSFSQTGMPIFIDSISRALRLGWSIAVAMATHQQRSTRHSVPHRTPPCGKTPETMSEVMWHMACIWVAFFSRSTRYQHEGGKHTSWVGQGWGWRRVGGLVGAALPRGCSLPKTSRWRQQYTYVVPSQQGLKECCFWALQRGIYFYYWLSIYEKMFLFTYKYLLY